ncbi:MAG: hypothetical protein HFE78_08140 [Clostridiales bacterium]|nr:hypothetical protein [Clostridiales bacterium]
MHKVYVLYEERESSQMCRIKGVWSSKEDAIIQMQNEIHHNSLYSEYSHIDINAGIAQSDPTYSEEVYSDYSIKCFDIS